MKRISARYDRVFQMGTHALCGFKEKVLHTNSRLPIHVHPSRREEEEALSKYCHMPYLLPFFSSAKLSLKSRTLELLVRPNPLFHETREHAEDVDVSPDFFFENSRRGKRGEQYFWEILSKISIIFFLQNSRSSPFLNSSGIQLTPFLVVWASANKKKRKSFRLDLWALAFEASVWPL